MKLIFKQAELQDALKLATAATTNALAGCLFEVEDGTIRVFDSTKNTSFKMKVAAEVDGKPIDFMPPLHLLAELVTQLSSEEKIELEVVATEGLLNIKRKGGSYKVRLLDADTAPPFPHTPEEKEALIASLVRSDFVDVLKSVDYATSAKDTRPMLTGVCLTKKEGSDGMVLCATDAYRLAIIENGDNSETAEGTDIEKTNFVLPAEVTKLVEKIPSEKITILTDSGHKRVFVLGDGDYVLASALLQGAYPPYEKLFPEESTIKTEVLLNKQTLLDALKRVKPLLTPATNSVTFQFDDTKLGIKVENAEVGEAEEELEYEKIENKPSFALTLRLPHLVDALQSFKNSTKVTMRLQGEAGKPIIISSSEEEKQKALIMPA